jgi:hypothetical protein
MDQRDRVAGVVTRLQTKGPADPIMWARSLKCDTRRPEHRCN